MKPALTWGVAASCLLLLTGAMAWATWSLVGMEGTRQRMEGDALVQERSRLALWRMESVAAALVLEESARAPEQYETPADASATSSGVGPDDRVWLHFEMDPDGRVHSPQVPEENDKPGASPPGESARRLQELRGRLAEKAGPEQWAFLGHGRERSGLERSVADNRAWLSYANSFGDPLPQADGRKDAFLQKADTKSAKVPAGELASNGDTSKEAPEARIPSALKPAEAQREQENYNKKEADIRQQLIAGNYSQRRSQEQESLERKTELIRSKEKDAAPEALGLQIERVEGLDEIKSKTQADLDGVRGEPSRALAANTPAAPGAPAAPPPSDSEATRPPALVRAGQPVAPAPVTALPEDAGSPAEPFSLTQIGNLWETATPSTDKKASAEDRTIAEAQPPAPSLAPAADSFLLPRQPESLAKGMTSLTATPPLVASRRGLVPPAPAPASAPEVTATINPPPQAAADTPAAATAAAAPPALVATASKDADGSSAIAGGATGARFSSSSYFGVTAPNRVNNVSVSDFRALWIRDALFLTRRVSRNGTVSIQGAWVDWPKLRANLLATVADLFPAASLEPAPAALGGGTDLLASLPVRFLPGNLKLPAYAFWSPLKLSLATAWACVLLATVAVLLVLRGMMLLSERRASFVSAVTHELRTPLATFKLYSEMLADGMVKEASKRQRYLETLSSEADRLGHLVENVLSYSRLESGKVPGGRAPVALRDLLQRLGPRLSQRVEQAGGEWQISADALPDDISLTTDPAAVEQILFNLVDNACKYARRDGAAARVELDLRAEKGRVLFALRDYGPGISRAESKKLFRPFHKSARDAAHTAPGVGLGLALCRRLARDLGGTLEPDHTWPHGACFVLRLPV